MTENRPETMDRVISNMEADPVYSCHYDEHRKTHWAVNANTGMRRSSTLGPKMALWWLYRAERTPAELRAFYAGITGTGALTDVERADKRDRFLRLNRGRRI